MSLTILITGTRTDARKGALVDALEALSHADVEDSPWLIFGDATGVDAEAWELAKFLGWMYERFEADWHPGGPGSPLDRSAGPRRNAKMVQFARERGAIVLALPHPDPTKRRGTNDCIRQAKAAGLVVFEVL